jgi:hypothetical protein
LYAGTWTLTHGFFMGMGGFILQNDECRVFPIIFNGRFKDHSGEFVRMEPDHFKFENLYENVKQGEIFRAQPPIRESQSVDVPPTPRATENNTNNDGLYFTSSVRPEELSTGTANQPTRMRIISEDEINDRSKGDALGKTIVLLQLTWFLIQIIARAIAGLHITPLEITTVAYIAVSAILYGLWWKKPKDIRYPISIALAAGDHVEKYKNATIWNSIKAYSVLFLNYCSMLP